MRPHDDKLFLGHMLDMARVAQELMAGATRDQLDRDVKLQLALVRALQVIGEAAWRVSERFKKDHPGTRGTRSRRFVIALFTITFPSITTSSGELLTTNFSR